MATHNIHNSPFFCLVILTALEKLYIHLVSNDHFQYIDVLCHSKVCNLTMHGTTSNVQCIIDINFWLPCYRDVAFVILNTLLALSSSLVMRQKYDIFCSLSDWLDNLNLWISDFFKFCYLLLLKIVAGYDELHECSLQKKYIGKKVGQAYSCSICNPLHNVRHWCYWKVSFLATCFFVWYNLTSLLISKSHPSTSVVTIHASVALWYVLSNYFEFRTFRCRIMWT